MVRVGSGWFQLVGWLRFDLLPVMVVDGGCNWLVSWLRLVGQGCWLLFGWLRPVLQHISRTTVLRE